MSGDGIWGLGDSSECKNLRDRDDEGSSEDVDVVLTNESSQTETAHVRSVLGMRLDFPRHPTSSHTPLASRVTWLLHPFTSANGDDGGCNGLSGLSSHSRRIPTSRRQSASEYISDFLVPYPC